MATKPVTAEAFWMAFQALSIPEQRAVIERLLQDEDFREQLMGVVQIEERRSEPSGPLPEFLAERRRTAQR